MTIDAPSDFSALFDLTGRSAVVVGAGSGIGASAASGLAGFGAHVVCADVNTDGLEQTAQAITDDSGSAATLHLDLTEHEQVAAAARDLPVPDVLVVTPSINVRKRLIDMTSDEFHRVVSVNLEGAFQVTREFGKAMSDQGRGSIIVFSSIRAEVVEPGQGVYAATKAGAVQMVRTLAAELGPHGVRANLIAPGVVETPLTAPIKQDPDWYGAYAAKPILGRWSTPRELVGAVVFLASEASSYVTGSYLVVDGGWLAADGRYTPPL